MEPKPELSDAEFEALKGRISAGFRQAFEDAAEVRRRIEARKNRALAIRLTLVVIAFGVLGLGFGWVIDHVLR